MNRSLESRPTGRRLERLSNLRIRTKLLLGNGVILAVLLAAGIVGLEQLETGLQEALGTNSHSLARSLVTQVEQRVLERQAQMRQLVATNTQLVELLRTSNDEMATLGDDLAATLAERDAAWQAKEEEAFIRDVESSPTSELLRDQLSFFAVDAGYAVFGEIFLTNRHGANVAMTRRTSDYVQNDEPWWQTTWEKGTLVGEVGYDASAEILSVELGVRVEDIGGTQLGVLKAVLDLEDIHRMLRDFERGYATEGASIELYDGTGKPIYPLSAQPRDVARQDAGRLFWLEADDTGQTWLRTVARSPRLGWRGYLSRPAGAIFAPTVQLRQQVLAIGAAVVGLALLVTLLISVSITRPIGHAVKMSNTMAQGDLGVVIHQFSGDEAGQLLASLAQMAENVRLILQQLYATAHSVTMLADALADTGRHITDASRHQSAAKDSAIEAVGAMKENIKELALSFAQVREEVMTASASIEMMAASTDVISSNADHLHRSAGETMQTVRRLLSSIELVAANASAAGSASQHAVEVARRGDRAITHTGEGMREIVAAIENVVASHDGLLAASRKISDATAAIEDISKQTNLLALNAAIEASNAGVHGHGFAVVAAEVQKLADRSAGSTREISGLVLEVEERTEHARRITDLSVDRARHGLKLVGDASSALREIVASASSVNEGMHEIHRVTRQQTHVAENLAGTFESIQERSVEVRELTDETVTGAEHVRQTMALINELAQSFSGIVRRHRQQGDHVEDAMDHIADTSAAHRDIASDIVQATRVLRHEAQELAALTEFFSFKGHGLDEPAEDDGGGEG